MCERRTSSFSNLAVFGGGSFSQYCGLLLFVILVSATGGSARADLARESPEQRFARDAFRELRESTFLVTACERAFLDFWRAYISDGPKGLIVDPAGDPEHPYFGLGNTESQPLLAPAQDMCAEETGARGDLVVRVLKERENRKWRRAQKLEHAERIIGY